MFGNIFTGDLNSRSMQINAYTERPANRYHCRYLRLDKNETHL